WDDHAEGGGVGAGLDGDGIAHGHSSPACLRRGTRAQAAEVLPRVAQRDDAPFAFPGTGTVRDRIQFAGRTCMNRRRNEDVALVASWQGPYTFDEARRADAQRGLYLVWGRHRLGRSVEPHLRYVGISENRDGVGARVNQHADDPYTHASN